MSDADGGLWRQSGGDFSVVEFGVDGDAGVDPAVVDVFDDAGVFFVLEGDGDGVAGFEVTHGIGTFLAFLAALAVLGLIGFRRGAFWWW